MSASNLRRAVRATAAIALVVLAAAGCSSRQDQSMSTGPSQYKPGVAAYPPNMKLGPDGKPVAKSQ